MTDPDALLPRARDNAQHYREQWHAARDECAALRQRIADQAELQRAGDHLARACAELPSAVKTWAIRAALSRWRKARTYVTKEE